MLLNTEVELNQLIDRKVPVNIICTLMKYEKTFKIATHGFKTSLTEDKYEILSANLRKSPIHFQSLTLLFLKLAYRCVLTSHKIPISRPVKRNVAFI